MVDQCTLVRVRQDVSFATRAVTVSPMFGGIAGLSYPLVLVVTALSVGFRSGGGMGDFAASIAAAILFVIAAPTAWLLAFSFIDVSRFGVLMFGIVTSSLLWVAAGRILAVRSRQWIDWLKAYAVLCVVWTVANFVVFGVVGSLFS